ncbi:cold-shock protein [Bifidobacterium gallicum]|nr:cold shock domain-containing protein [Bifidobacterium gallicum]KFI58917.1 cold-shock protein [Bifidobacterium gallicum DSM 20093 = LMG 11596]
MPSGKIRWYDANKGYGFIENEEGKDVFLPAMALPAGVTTLRKGTKVEYSVIDGRKGPQAMGLEVIASAPSLVKATRPKPDDMAAIVEDLIKLLDTAGNGLRRHHYPSAADSRKLATLLRAVADNFDVQE